MYSNTAYLKRKRILTSESQRATLTLSDNNIPYLFSFLHCTMHLPFTDPRPAKKPSQNQICAGLSASCIIRVKDYTTENPGGNNTTAQIKSEMSSGAMEVEAVQCSRNPWSRLSQLTMGLLEEYIYGHGLSMCLSCPSPYICVSHNFAASDRIAIKLIPHIKTV